MMKLGPYEVKVETLYSLALNLFDAQRVRLSGVPRFSVTTPVDIATMVLQHNAGAVLNAGQGHFWFMWPSDFGKAIRGALLALPPSYIGNLIELMIKESARQGEVTSCFSARGSFHGFNMPYARADNLPWLLHALYEYEKVAGPQTSARLHKELQFLVDQWEASQLEDGLVAKRITGDWMDTLLRPSSTYNNLCALHMFHLLPKLGLVSKTHAKKFEERILKERLHKGYFIDYAGTKRESVDSAVVALYLELFTKDLRNKLADRLEQSGLAKPFPIRCATQPYPRQLVSPVARVSANYHSAIWLHLGLMYVNGLSKLGRDTTSYKTTIDSLIQRYGNVLETLTPQGKLYMTPFHATEYGLSMAAGQYLELAKPRRA